MTAQALQSKLSKVFEGSGSPTQETDSTDSSPNSGRLPDGLALGIVEIARRYGLPCNATQIVGGLPLVEGRLPLEHVALAARMAGLTSDVSPVELRRLRDVDLPVLLSDTKHGVAIVWAIVRSQYGAIISLEISRPAEGAVRHHVAHTDLELTNAARMVRLRPGQPKAGQPGFGAAPAAREPWLLPAFRQSRRIYSEAIMASLAINVLALALPLFSMNVYDRVLPNAAADTLWALAIGVTVAIGFEFWIKHLRANCVDAASRRADVELGNMIYARMLGARLNPLATSTGVRSNTLREFETLRDFFNSATVTAFGDLPFLLIFLIVMFVVAGPLALIAVAAVPIMLGIGWLTQRALTRHIQVAFKDNAQKSAVIVETLGGLESIKATGAESWAAARWERALADGIRSSIEIRQISNAGLHAITTTQNVLQIALIVVGFYMVSAGQLTVGALTAATMLAARAMAPLTTAAMLLARLHQARMAYTSLSEIVASPQERPADATFLAKSDLSGAIAFESVSFTYEPDAPPALADVSLTIKPGERVALIGGIGSGKTTALKLMQGLLVASKGRVLIDDCSIGALDPSLLRASMALLPQDPELFHGTIRTNITIGDPGAADQDVLHAAASVGALEWIGRLPRGFDTMVRERGGGLSGGQRQLVALARAMIRSPKIILLDEPTSHMDGRTEQGVLNALAKTAEGRTLVFVTHRPALLDIATRIIVFEGGKVLLDGPRATILEQLKAVTERRVAGQGK